MLTKTIERTLGQSGLSPLHEKRESYLWPLLRFNTLLGLYFLERWLIRPRVASLLAKDEMRNVGVPDAFVALLFIGLFFTSGGPRRILAVARFFGPMLAVFFAGGWFAIFTAAGGFNTDISRAFWASAQIAFSFFVLGPVLLQGVEDLGLNRSLFSYGAWIGLAGVLSITDKLGVTGFGNLDYYRQENAILGVNGFYIVGPFLPLMLFGLSQTLGKGRYVLSAVIAVIILLSHIGLFLAGVRTGLIITALGWCAGIAICLRYGQVERLGIKDYLVGIAIILMVGGVVAGTEKGRELTSLDTFVRRADTDQGLLRDTDRTYVFGMALDELMQSREWIVGNGINQWVVIRPNTEVIHNVFIMAWWECGILGLIGWCLLYVRPYIALRKHSAQFGRSPAYQGLIWCSSFIVFGAIMGGIVYPIGYSRTDWLWFVLAVTPVMLRRKRVNYVDHHVQL